MAEDESARIVAPDATDLERAAEAALRPKRLADFVGQATVRSQLQLLLDAARGRGVTPDHVLLAGPPGLGKTMLVRTLAQVLELDFSRIQFTPDLMPADITGTNILATYQSQPFTGSATADTWSNLLASGVAPAATAPSAAIDPAALAAPSSTADTSTPPMASA